MIEEAFITCSTLAGAIFGTAVFPKLYRRTKGPGKELVQQHLIKSHGLAKAELESLKFERSLLREAITRIYEAEQEGRIDAMERDRLLLKYKHQLNIYNEKIDVLLPLLDLSELSDMRDDVVNLLEKRITAIDQNLAQLSKKYETSPADNSIFKSKGSTDDSSTIFKRDSRQQEQVSEIDKGRGKSNADSEQLVERDYNAIQGHDTSVQSVRVHEYKKRHNIHRAGENISEPVSEGKNIEKLQHEIMEALSRLEEAGMNNEEYSEYDNMHTAHDNNDKDNNFSAGQDTAINSNTTDKSCLRQLR
jgi:hypothetical protein